MLTLIFFSNISVHSSIHPSVCLYINLCLPSTTFLPFQLCDLTHACVYHKKGSDKLSHCLHWVNCCFVNSQIYCDEGIADVVLRVDEPLSCSYVIIVHTNKLCQHSLFRPNPAQKPHAITCSPALSEERYKIYVERIGKMS